MLRLRIKSSDNPITGKVTLGGRSAKFGAISVTPEKEAISVSGYVMSWSDWYSLFTQTKRNAILYGGTVLDKSFNGLVREYYKSSAIRTINGCPPADDGSFRVIGDANIQLCPAQDSQLMVSVFKSGVDKARLLQDITRLVWRLYHAINYLSKRVRVFDPTNYTEYPLGRCFGTLPEQQAQVCRWNHYVWLSSYIHTIESCSERLAIGVGYTATDCDVTDVTITCTLTISDDSLLSSISDSIAALTLFKMGKSGNLGELPESKPNPIVSTALTKLSVDGNTYEVSGTGRDRNMHTWKSMQIVIKLPEMISGEQYLETFALAVGSGTETELSIPDSDSGITIPIVADIVWEINRSGVVETRTKTISDLSIIAINAVKIDSEE